MKLTNQEWLRAGGWLGLLSIVMGVMGMALEGSASGQAFNTTTVQGTVYLANGQPGSGTLVVSWPSFTTANGQLVTADSTTIAIAPDGFISVSLAPNLGSTPAGEYYTAVYYLSDGSTSTQYWVVPAAAQATLGQVQAQLMPATQAVQTVSKAYVDQAISELTDSLLTASGGTLTGPLTLCCDPTQPLQAADKHYVDSTFALAVPLAGGSMTGALTAPAVNGVESPAAGSSQTTLQSAMNAAGSNGALEIPPGYAGTDNFTNPNGVYVADLRRGSSQQFERSVKEFGAVCDGSTDDTNALQAALNYAQAHGVALSIPQGTCKTQTLIWHGESIGGMGKQVSALMGFPGQDVLLTGTDSVSILSNTRIHDLTIYVDQSQDISCSAAKGLAPAGGCGQNRPMESNSIFSLGGNGLTGTQGTGTAWAVGNCAIAMPASTGAGGNGLKVAEIENVKIATTGMDPMAAQYPGAHSTHTCGLYLAQWPVWSDFRNIDIRGLNTGIAIPALPGTTPAGLNADSNRWENITIQATHGFTAAAGTNNVLDNVVSMAGNSAATGEPPTGLVLDFAGAQQGWTVRNSVVLPVWNAVQPALTVSAYGGAVTAVAVGAQAGLGFDPYGAQVPLSFSGSCTAHAVGNVNSSGAIGSVTITSGGAGCSNTTTASVNVAGTWDTDAAVNLISGQSMSFYGGNLLKGNGGYTVWNATNSMSYGTQLGGGGGSLPGGGSYTALVANSSLGSASQVDQFPGSDFGAKLQACLNTLSGSYGGTCDARNFTGNLSMGSNLTISTANATVQLPCATISTSNQIIVTAGTRNVSLRGCALRGASTASGSQGGTVFLYSGTGAMVQVGDPTYAADTKGFHLDNAVINTTIATSATAQGLAAYRTQEMDLESLYFLGNSNQTGMTLDGTGNYTGGTFLDNDYNGFQIAVNGIGHQISNPATTDWLNASTFVRLHINCPTSGGSPISGSYGINLQQGDGNTFTGGDVEGCWAALHLGTKAQNNTIIGLRNENSTSQIVADAGSSYNSWISGGTIFTGALTDNGTRNSFLDTFHRSFNGLNGDWYGSQKDATITNHYRLGIGLGDERGLLERYQTDYGYRWTTGLSDATAGEQFYQILDELNNVYRLSIGQYNNGQSSTNNQTVINSAGTGAIVLNGSNNSGTGGVVIGSGGVSETTVATINNAGNAQFNGTLQVGGISTFAGTTTVKNQADAEIDATLWAGLTASQKESFSYKDWNGNSQWYMVKDASNNWALNSATGGLDSFKAYQSANSGDTYVNASNASGVVRINYETGAGNAFNIYGGGSNSLYASFTGAAAIKFPGLAASSGHNCLQIDNSGFITNTGAACGTGSTNGTVNAGTSGQIAYYSGTGTAISGTNTVSITAGGTGASTASGALSNLGGAALSGSLFTGPVSIASTLSVANNISIGPRYDVTNSTFGAKGDGSTDDTLAIQAAFNACWNSGASPHGGIIEFPGNHDYVVSSTINAYDGCQIEGTIGNGGGGYSPPRMLWNGSIPGTAYNITGVTIAANSTPVYAASSPAPFPQPNIATFTASNSLSAGQWVDIEGLSSTGGMGLNRGILQVASATATSFTVTVPYAVTTGSFTDTGTATTANVFIALDANARYEQAVSNILLANKTVTQSNTYQVGFYFSSRVDTGTRIWHGEVSGATSYSYYFPNGGINVDFDKGWRADGAGIAGIYWRVGGSDSFGIANGTVDNNRGPYGSASSGAAVILDNQFACGIVNFTSRNIKVEVNTTLTPGLGVFTLYDCPSAGNGEQFLLSLDTTWVAPASSSTAGFNFSSFVMSPANDKALVLSAMNSQFTSGLGSNTTAAFVGIPGLSRGNILGAGGWTPLLTYSPSIASSAMGPSTSASPTQVFGDLNISQLWQYGIHASGLLYTDTAFAALPNATTLYAGQIIAPPNYWNGANGKRYALDVVYQSGTTGSPNGGATICSGTSGTSVLICTSATDLSAGGQISIGTDTNKTINFVDATQPGAVLVNLTNNLNYSHTSQTLAYAAPLLGSEIQMPTKSSSAPSTLAWSQGDMEENSGATSNGIAAWVNVSAGTPGTWAGVPLGNSSGQISSSQIASGSLQGTDVKILTAGIVSGTAVPLCTDANGGATTAGCPVVTGIVGVANGGTGASSASAALTNLGAVSTSTMVNGHALSSNVTVSASDLTTGTLAHAQLPALVSGDIPNNAANTSGTAAGFTGTLAGDVTGAQSSTTVGKINGGSIPASANALSTNASSQLVVSTSHNLSIPANCSAASGSGTAYTCSTSPTFTPASGDHIQFKADVANTGSATLAVNGAAAATIKKWGRSGNLIANDLLSGHWISATFDGSYWQLEGQLGNANATQINGTAISALSGSGSVLALTASPVFTTPTLGAASATSMTTSASSTFAGSANTFNNAAAAENDVIVQAGSGAAQAAAYQLNTYAGTATWKLRMDASNYLRFNDVANSLDREVFYQNGQTLINSGAGANAVVINGSTSSGTGGLLVESGSSSPAAVLTVTGSGNTTATGFVSGKFMIGSGTMTLATGAAAGTSPTIVCAASHVCDGVSGTVTLTTGTSPTTGTLATLSYPNTHTNQANCVVDVLQSGVGRVTTPTWSESTTAVTLTANTALTASTAYTVKYWCGGN